MTDSKQVKIGDFLKRIKRPIRLEKNEEYMLVTVKMHHKGVVLREKKLGKNIGSNMYVVRAGDFILSGIDARNGAFGIVPNELDGAIVTNDFWYFEIDDDVIDKHFFLELTSTAWFDDICKKGSDGTTQRIRLQKDKFYNQEISLPSIDNQKPFIKKFLNIKSLKSELNAEISSQTEFLSKLRQSILQEAIEGKLTEQWRQENPDAEPASKLLEKIRAEKEQLIKEKKIKKEKPLPKINEDEIPFDAPDNWEWVRLGDICSKIGSGSTPRGSNYSENGVPFFRSQNIYNNGLVYDDIKYISSQVHDDMSGTSVYKNDVLLNITGGSMGRCALVPNDFIEGNVSQHVCIIRPIIFNSSLMHKIVLSPFFQTNIFSSTTGAGREGLPKNNLEQFPIPLIPMEEQQVILEKIHSLLNICDELEQQINGSKANAEMLMQAVLKEAFEQ